MITPRRVSTAFGLDTDVNSINCSSSTVRKGLERSNKTHTQFLNHPHSTFILYCEEGVLVLLDEGGLDLRRGASVDEREEEGCRGSNI